MSIKGTRTEQNLLAAFSGESMARNKYLFFAEKAQQEGHHEIAELFRKMAQNEAIHGKLLLQKLDGLKDTSANLQTAIKGEYSEWNSMYPDFADVAREEGFEEIAELFESIGKIEQNHEFTFMQALVELTKANQMASHSHLAKELKQKRTVEVQGYRCTFCGAMFEEYHDVCSVCQAIGAFEPANYNKNI